MKQLQRYKNDEGKTVMVVERTFFKYLKIVFTYVAQEDLTGHWTWLSMPKGRKVHYAIEEQLNRWNRAWIKENR